MALDSFIFGGNTGLTYEQLKRRRAVAAALAAQRRGFPKTVGEGLTYLGESIGDTIAERRLDAAEQAMAAGDRAALNPPMTAPAAPAARPAPAAAPARPVLPSAPVRPPVAPVSPRPAPTAAALPPPPVLPSGPSSEAMTSGPPPSEFAMGGILNAAPLAAPNLDATFPVEGGGPAAANALPSSGYLPPAALATAPPSTPQAPAAAPPANAMDTAAQWPAGAVNAPPTSELQPTEVPRRVSEPAAPGPQSSVPPPDAGDTPPNVLAQAQQVALQGGPAAVSRFMADAGYPKSGAWCGQFAASILSSSGVQPPAGPAVASNWRNIGTPVDTPQVGDVAIARPGWAPRRGSGETGQTGSHVTFVNQADPTGTFQGLGGNQGNMVKPFNARDFEFRRLPGDVQGHRIIGIPGEEPPETQVAAYASAGGVSDAPIPGMGGAGAMQIRPRPQIWDVPPPDEQVTPTDIEPAPPTAQFGPPAGQFTRSDAPVPGVPAAPAGRPPMQAGAAVPPPIEPMDPGLEPRAPAPTAEMQHWRSVGQDLNRSDQTRALAQGYYNEALKAQREDFTRQWSVWKAEKLKFDDPATRLQLRQSQLANEKAVRDLEGEGFRPLTPEELKGLPTPPPGQIVYANRRGELKFGPTPPASTTVNVDTKATGKGQEKLQEKMAEQFVEMFTAGNTAADDLRTVTEMRELATRVKTGPEAVAKQFAGRWGIKTEGVSNIEALNAMINRIIPQQRVPGSGTSSDFDSRMFQASVPALMNTPGGNDLIMDTMEGASRNKMARSEVAGKVISGQLTVQEGVKETLALQAQARAMSDRVKDFLVKGGAATDTTGSTMSRENQRALDWATQNPTDPRAQEIKKRLGVP